MTTRSLLPALCVLVPCVLSAAPSTADPSFETMVAMSDRIVVGTVQGATGESVTLPGAGTLVLGIKDGSTGLVFTSYRVRTTECLFDKDDACRLEDFEVSVPGGTIYETVDGQRRLRTWEVAGAAGVPLPPAGEDVLLFMSKRNDRYLPLNTIGSRTRVDRTAGSASVVLRFGSPRFLSTEGRESARANVAAGDPATTRPVFVESVSIDRLKELILQARKVLKPTSGIRDAIPDRADAYAFDALREHSTRPRAGEVSQRCESPLGLGEHFDSTHRRDDRGRERGP